MSAPLPWTYTFCDVRTDTELATVPMVGVNFEKLLNGAGKFEGIVPTNDPAIRALDPWSAIIPRRTAVYVSYGDRMLWGGLVWQVERSQGVAGLKITAATFDAWLATQLLTVDLSFTNQTAVSMVTALIAQVQSLAGGNLNIRVLDTTAPTVTPQLRSRSWPRQQLQDAIALIASFLMAAVPIEWRFDCSWGPDGRVAKTLVIGEPRIGVPFAVSGLSVWHDVTRPDSTLLTFTDLDDGTVQANACAAAIALNGSTPLWSFHTSAEIGNDEVGAGFPLVMKDVSTVGQTANFNTQANLDDAVLGAVADVQSQGNKLTNFAVRPDLGDGAGGLALDSFDVGDELSCEITHPAYPEFPGAAVVPVRILGRKITPRTPGAPDKVDLTVWDAASPRLPRSTTLVAHMRDLQRRVLALEVK